MHPIYTATTVASLVAVAVIGGFTLHRAEARDRGRLIRLFLAMLPLWILAFYVVRIPVLVALRKAFGVMPGHPVPEAYLWVTSFLAPLTEDPAKLLPLLLPGYRLALEARLSEPDPDTRGRRGRPSLVVSLALATGLGFGISEMWGIAQQIAHAHVASNLRWYEFQGFMLERLQVCVLHAGFVSVTLAQVGHRPWLGLLGTMSLHYLANLPVVLAAAYPTLLPRATMQSALALWVTLFFVAMVALLALIDHRERRERARPDPR